MVIFGRPLWSLANMTIMTFTSTLILKQSHAKIFGRRKSHETVAVICIVRYRYKSSRRRFDINTPTPTLSLTAASAKVPTRRANFLISGFNILSSSYHHKHDLHCINLNRALCVLKSKRCSLTAIRWCVAQQPSRSQLSRNLRLAVHMSLWKVDCGVCSLAPPSVP